MNIVFYNNLSDYNTINKNITEVLTLTGTLKDGCSITNPVIRIENTGIVNANYCYIEEFGRFYFIDEQTILSNKVISISMSVDVLESFKTQILGLNVIIDNSTNIVDKYIEDEIWKSKVKTSTTILNFDSGFNDSGEYILITAGG
ncbi:MAG: hypothetical protein IKY67_13790 [Paludibacteraceae bacterium]|nr:hypothetical protein [Paludibacteraceae bacterium]